MSTHREVIYTPKYQGARFKEHRLPLDLVEDLDTLRKMTIEMAKYIYSQNHPHKKRIPKNFTEGISFELERIDEGSTIPTIVLISAMTGLFPQHQLDYFTQAGQRIIEVISLGEDTNTKSFDLPETVLLHFQHLGKKLHDDESIEFKPYSSGNKAVFTKESRKRILLASSKTKEYTSEVNVKGLITAVDKLKQSFTLQLLSGDRVSGNYQTPQQEIIMEAFNKMENKQRLILLGTGTFNNNDKLVAISEIDDLNLLDPYDIATRLEELSYLNEGWLDGQGKSLDKKGLVWLSHKFEQNYNTEILPLPAAFPTPEGHVQFEWSLESGEVTLEVNLDNYIGHFYYYDIIKKEESKHTLHLQNENGWKKLNTMINKLINNE